MSAQRGRRAPRRHERNPLRVDSPTWKSLACALATAALLAPASPTAAQEKDYASWWVTHYGLVDPAQEPLAERAESIFEPLAAAADKRASRLPRLAILDAEGQPFAMALPDGTVLLTRGALRLCYRRVSKDVGDHRLAFVIGHELSHLGNDDFWHAAAFDAMKQHGGNGGRASQSALELLHDDLEDVTRRELQADGYGLLYMTIAGYDPRALVGEESFFDAWANELDALGVRTLGRHPDPAERAALIESQIEAVTRELDFFHFGVRLVQLGRYRDGLLLLERFRDRFASREVLNAIGLAHYQLAARYLGNCDGRLVVRFLLPTLIDPTTRAVRLRSGSGSSPCFQAERFQLHFREAERNLEEASQMDPDYLAAKLNLLSLHALAERGAESILAADQAAELAPEDPRVRSGAAVALYLYGEQSGLEMADTAIGQLQILHATQPESKEAAYNLASMLAERRRVQSAEEAYLAYLELEGNGRYADAARDYLGAPQPAPAATTSGPSPESPLHLGVLDREALEREFPDATVEDFVIGDFRGAFIHITRGKALVIDDTIEIVEEEISRAESREMHGQGPPLREERTTTGRMLFFDRVALDDSRDPPTRIFY